MQEDRGAQCYRRFREQGDESGLIEIIKTYKDGLILYLSTYSGDLHTAEELAEDTFVLLGTRKPRDRGKGSFKTWLYTIGRNLAIDRLRKLKRSREVSADTLPDLPDERAALEAAYMANERKRTVNEALNTLRPDYQRILWLVYFEELSLREAAKVMGKSTHAAETLVYRARTALRAKLETEGYTFENL